MKLDLDEFDRINLQRCESPQGFNHKLESWSLSDWMTATMGELGEAANIVKKLNRYRDGINGNTETEAILREKLGRELADAFIYLSLTAQAAGVKLSEVVPAVFDAKSEQIGYPVRLVEPHAEPTKPSGADYSKVIDGWHYWIRVVPHGCDGSHAGDWGVAVFTLPDSQTPGWWGLAGTSDIIVLSRVVEIGDHVPHPNDLKETT